SRWELVNRFRSFSLQANAMREPTTIGPGLELGQDGGSLPAVLDDLVTNYPERHRAFTEELGRWFPEFDWLGDSIIAAARSAWRIVLFPLPLGPTTSVNCPNGR